MKCPVTGLSGDTYSMGEHLPTPWLRPEERKSVLRRHSTSQGRGAGRDDAPGPGEDVSHLASVRISCFGEGLPKDPVKQHFADRAKRDMRVMEKVFMLRTNGPPVVGSYVDVV